MGLPDATGVELMRHLHAEHGLQGVTLFGYGMEEDLRRRSRDAGFVVCLFNPVDFRQPRAALGGVTTPAGFPSFP